MTVENDLWDSSLELEYQIGFDRSIYVEPVAGKDPKAPIPPKPIEKPQTIPPIKQPNVEKKHITRDGK